MKESHSGLSRQPAIHTRLSSSAGIFNVVEGYGFTVLDVDNIFHCAYRLSALLNVIHASIMPADIAVAEI